MPKKEKLVDEAAEATDSDVRGAADPEETAPATPAEVKKGRKTSFDVHNKDGGFIRTYSVEQHGKDAEKLAEEYAGKIDGSVK